MTDDCSDRPSFESRSSEALLKPAPLHLDTDSTADVPVSEGSRARRLADRYRLEFVDMEKFRIDAELFRSIPADLMLRYKFVPRAKDGDTL